VTAPDSDDQALVERLVRDRDPTAFHQLYLRHTPMLFAIALRRVENVPDAEDAVHDTWVRGVEGLHQFRGASTLRTWLTGVLINRLRESARARKHVPLDEVPEIASAESDFVSPDVDPLDVSRALASMPDGYREIVLLHDVEGFTHEEIGQLLGIEAGTSKSQLARGRQWLRATLQPDRGKAHE
jgi:RNA polymerase sigma factor (sigma-70 family)